MEYLVTRSRIRMVLYGGHKTSEGGAEITRRLPLAHRQVRNLGFLLNSSFRRRSSTINWTVMTDAWRRGVFRFSGTYLAELFGNSIRAFGCFRNTYLPCLCGRSLSDS
jgi:hypothetical protein